jgi:hypothetical protein
MAAAVELLDLRVNSAILIQPDHDAGADGHVALLIDRPDIARGAAETDANHLDLVKSYQRRKIVSIAAVKCPDIERPGHAYP